MGPLLAGMMAIVAAAPARAAEPHAPPERLDPWREQARREVAELPRPPAPPATAPTAHPIDAFLGDWWSDII